MATVQHIGVTCNKCSQSPIEGPRFKCGNCENFNLCIKCEPNHDHEPQHMFLKIRQPLPQTDPAPLNQVLAKMSHYAFQQAQSVDRSLGWLNVPICHLPKRNKQELAFDVSFDFEAAANVVYEGLLRVDARTELGDPEHLKKVMIKYLKFLRLKNKYADVHMVAPDEVEALWQTHLIRNDMYRQDCMTLFGEVVDHHIEIKPCMQEKGIQSAKMYWGIEYNECWDDLENMTLPDDIKDKATKIQVTIEDVIADRAWIGYYRTYTSNVTDWDAFLNRSKMGYKRFLGLCGEDLTNADAMEPTYAMDLFWHTHMFHPIEYNACCEGMSGFLIVHEPWPKSMTVEQMFIGQEKFDERWQKRFGESIHDYTF